MWSKEESANAFHFFFLLVLLNYQVVLTWGNWWSHYGVLSTCLTEILGVGLVGICLAHVEASKVIVSDGDLSTLMNMKLNLESNNFSIDTDRQGRTEDSNTIKCIHLPWESASENELQDFMPDVILGADVIYDPACLPYLVRLLAILLNKKMPSSAKRNDSCQGSLLDSKSMDGKFNGSLQGNANANDNGNGFDANGGKIIYNGTSNTGSRKGPVAYIASVIRNIDTFNHFLSLES
ncbi:putative protein n-methyltransferase fam86b1 [Quercus suber]|uniref:Uncharacterized protein n=1 Tax=Quercus suber TaxID=58331 RepID=A0AAW0J425_QUESU